MWTYKVDYRLKRSGPKIVALMNGWKHKTVVGIAVRYPRYMVKTVFLDWNFSHTSLINHAEVIITPATKIQFRNLKINSKAFPDSDLLSDVLSICPSSGFRLLLILAFKKDFLRSCCSTTRFWLFWFLLKTMWAALGCPTKSWVFNFHKIWKNMLKKSQKLNISPLSGQKSFPLGPWQLMVYTEDL